MQCLLHLKTDDEWTTRRILQTNASASAPGDYIIHIPPGFGTDGADRIGVALDKTVAPPGCAECDER